MTFDTKAAKKISLLVLFGFILSSFLFLFLIFGLPEKKSDRQLAEKTISKEIINNQLISPEENLRLRQKTQKFFSLIQRAENAVSLKKESLETTEAFDGNTKEPRDNVRSEPVKDELVKLEGTQMNESVAVDIWNDPLTKIVPQFYINYLNEMKDLLIRANFFDKENEIKFEKLNDVIAFWEKSIDYFVREGIIEAGQRNSYLAGVTSIWPKTLESEKYILPNWPEAKKTTGENLGFGSLLRQFVELLPIKKAFAIVCFKAGATAPGGVNMWAPCCACTTGVPPIPIGCLNSPHLGLFFNAIYDSATGICGIG